MGKRLSSLLHKAGRLVKLSVALLLIPPVIGLAQGLERHIDAVVIGARSFGEWVRLGALGYLGVHLLLYKPKALFRVQHRLLSRLSAWLFGGQVTTVNAKGERSERKPDKKAEKGKASGDGSQGSTLLVLSPYLVPLYAVLACAASWLFDRWAADADWLQAATAVLVGAGLVMHWVMTADDLQQDRGRFPLDAYLLALGIVGLVSLVIVSVSLPLAIPGFAVLSAYAEALSRTSALYSAVFHTLFL